MITLITAVPGSGKTLYAIELIQKYNQEKRLVYQNIEGLKKDKFQYPDLILEAPADWRDTPYGSVVLYDEAQQPHLYPATAKAGIVSDERLTAMETHRHSGHDLIFITQAPTLIHHHIRKLTGLHIHLYRARGLQKASRYEWSHLCDNPNDRNEQKRADFTLWSFPKKYYNYYQSSSLHTHKFSLPKKVKLLMVFLIPFAIYLFYRINQSELLSGSHQKPALENQEIIKEFSTENADEALAEVIHEEKAFEIKEVQEFVQISGCAVNELKKKCACYNHQGNLLSLNYKQCLIFSKSHLSKSMIKGGKNF